mmetsp:Transcript_25317/g.63913  ORF Transcript_25317/g.63913 Transcript_25317/m.63913 type:complete len:236 (-) Transcript_25317:74-781(-)
MWHSSTFSSGSVTPLPSRPTSFIQDHLEGSSSWWRPPMRMLMPRSNVRNFFSCRARVRGPGGSSTTSTRARRGQTATAAFCKQYRRRLSRVNHLSSASYSSPPPLGSSSGFPFLSRSLQRHCKTSIGGNGVTSSTPSPSSTSCGEAPDAHLSPSLAALPLAAPRALSGSGIASAGASASGMTSTASADSSNDRPSLNASRARNCEKRTSSGHSRRFGFRSQRRSVRAASSSSSSS